MASTSLLTDSTCNASITSISLHSFFLLLIAITCKISFLSCIMSDNISESAPPSQTKVELHHKPDNLMKDLMLWRRRRLNAAILVAATATWILMEVYRYNLVTLLSWLAMALVACLFFWGNIHRLLNKEAPDLSELEIKEETAVETANLFRRGMEEGIRLVFHMSAEREWFVFGGVVACLFVISEVARRLDFLTFCCMVVVAGTTIPAIYVKNEKKIRDLGARMKMRSQRVYSVVKDKFQKVKNKIAGQHRKKEIKEKKTE